MKHFWVLLFLMPGLSFAQEASDVNLSTTIRGNQEQPKVITIVPWQPPSGPDYLYRPLGSRLEHIFAPVERSELRRQLHFLESVPEGNEK